ncbi:hypothetical protein CZP2022_255 [Vibrio phage C-ZP2022]|nr:hypothetical protein CZP2022_255 [Vibrio phage C-ZP2022]
MAKIYIDFDSIFDTRIAVIKKLNRSAAKRLETATKYRRRLDDKFWQMDNSFSESDFRKGWENRATLIDFNDLRITGVIVEMRKERIERDGFFALGVKAELDDLVVNTWPFSLDDETKEALSEMLMETARPNSVEFVQMDPAHIPSDYFGSYREAIMYDMNYWFSHQWEGVAKRPLTHVRFITPLSFKGKDLPKCDIATLVAQATEELRPYMNYNPVPSDMFCCLT